MISLEPVDRTLGAVSRNFDKLKRLVVDTGGRSIGIRFGTGTWTWPAGSAKSGVTVVSHGLGRTPIVVFVCGATLNGSNETSAGEAGSYTSTQFSTQASLAQGLAPGAGAANTFAWLVIG